MAREDAQGCGRRLRGLARRGRHLPRPPRLPGTEVPLSSVYRGVAPFVATDFVKLALVVAFPLIALWLPARMVGA